MKRTHSSLVILAFVCFFGCATKERRADELIGKLEDPATGLNIPDASTVVAMRNNIGEQEEVRELISLGEVAGRKASDKFVNKPANNADVLLACYAYVIEKTNYRAATDNLKNFILDEPATLDSFWSVHFATHTLKVFLNQADIDTMTYYYTPEKIAGTVE